MDDNRRVRDVDRWNSRTFIHNDDEIFFGSNQIEGGVHTLQMQSTSVDFLYKPAQSKVMHVIFHGAIAEENADSSVPIFSGVNIGAHINASTLLFSDPTVALNKKLRIGWFCGGRDTRVPSVILRIIQHVARVGGYRRIILCGGSAGGFSALRAASQLPGSTAFIWNPQTNVGKYHARPVKELAKYAFRVDSFDEIPSKYLGNLSLLSGNNSFADCNIIYMQNRGDNFHYTNHLQPMVDYLYPGARLQVGANRLSPRHLFIVGAWSAGHQPPPRDMINQILRFASQNRLGEPDTEAVDNGIADILKADDFLSHAETAVPAEQS